MAEAATERPEQPLDLEPGRSRAEDPRAARAKAVGQGDRGREMLAHVEQGATLDDDEEAAALDHLLGAAAPTRHEVTVDYETPAGLVPLTFELRTLDTHKIDEAEQRNMNRGTGTIDRLTTDCEIVAEVTEALRDPRRRVKLRSAEFLTVTDAAGNTVTHASPALALDARFRDQLGLLSLVAAEVRRLAGFTADRLRGSRRLVNAVLD